MAPSFRTTVAAVLFMLDDCAPGYVWRVGRHRVVISYRGRTFMGLPKGPGVGHASGSASVEFARIRKLVRMLGVDMECARRHIAGL